MTFSPALSVQLHGPDGLITCTVSVTDGGANTVSKSGSASGNDNIAEAEVGNMGSELGGWQQC